MAAESGTVISADLRAQLLLQKKEFLRLTLKLDSAQEFGSETKQTAEHRQLASIIDANTAVGKILFRSAAPTAGFLGIDLPVAFIPGAGRKASEAMNQAIAYFEYGLVDDALQRFSELLKSSYSEQLSDTAVYYQVLAYQEMERYAAAENVLRQACRGISNQRTNILKGCSNKRTALLLVEQLIHQQRLAEAAQLIQRFEDTSSEYVRTAFRLHSAQYQASKAAAARRGLEQLSQIDSGDPETHRYQDRVNILLGYDYLDSSQPEQAKGVFHRINLHEEKAAQALLGLGMAEWGLGKQQAALTFWESVEATSEKSTYVRSLGLMVAYAQWQLGLEKKASATYRDVIAALKKENGQIKQLRRTMNGRNLQSLLTRKKNASSVIKTRDSVAVSLKKYLDNLYLNPQFATLMSDYKDVVKISDYVAAVIAMPVLGRSDHLALDDFVQLQKNLFQLRVKYEQRFRAHLNSELDVQQKIVAEEIVKANYFQARLIDSMLSLDDKK